MSKRKPRKTLKQKSTADSFIMEARAIEEEEAEWLSNWWFSMNIPVMTKHIQELVDALAPLRQRGIIGTVQLVPFEPEGYEGEIKTDKSGPQNKKPYVVTWWFMRVPIMIGHVPTVVDTIEPLRETGAVGGIQLVPFEPEQSDQESDLAASDEKTALH